MINYNGRKFRAVANTENGETSAETVFEYQQQGNMLTSVYSGGKVVAGQLIALVAADGSLDMRYQQLNTRGELMTGRCHSTPEVMANGKIRLHERWQWTSGDLSEGCSVIEEF